MISATKNTNNYY